MRIFVSEYLTCGAWGGRELPPSLLAEGRAMLSAVVADLLADPNSEIRITWDARAGSPGIPSRWAEAGRRPNEEANVADSSCVEVPSPHAPLAERSGGSRFRYSSPFACPDGLRIDPVTSSDEEAVRFVEALAWADAALIIAPETDGILARRCRAVKEANVTSLNATPEAIELCADKLQMYDHLAEHGIPTPNTRTLFEACSLDDGLHQLFVLKQRCGAGSQSMRLLSRSEFQRVLRNEASADQDPRAWIVQPYLAGRALSVAGLFDASGALRFLLPIAEQHLSDDGTFRYLGGRVPAEDVDTDAVRTLIHRAGSVISGLKGYIGFDVLLPDRAEMPVLIEINPRLTTSYVGYRSLCTQPPARWISPFAMPKDPPRFVGSVEFKVP